MPMILINGEAKEHISVLDRGLQYGDGLFETLAVINGQVLHWSRHWQRLQKACQQLYLPMPEQQFFLEDIKRVTGDKSKAVVKIIYTRGGAGRGYAFTAMQPTRVVMGFPWPDYSEDNQLKGVELFLCQTRLAQQPLLAGLKHLNRLENVLARHEWSDKKYAEGLVLDTDGNVIEATMSNVFLIKNQALFTPLLSQCGVEGITRQRLIENAKQVKIPVSITKLGMDDVWAADEMFVCNSLIGIWPVKKVQQKKFELTESQDSITRRLQLSINH